MSLRFILDEHLRGPLWRAILRHNIRARHRLDVIRVGDAKAIPLGMDDSSLIRWAEQQSRIIITLDKRTMPGHLAAHLATGGHCAGIFIVLPHAPIADVLAFLVVAEELTDPGEWRDRIEYIK